MGDPQAPFAKVLKILDRHHLLTASGALRSDTQLVVMGDYFDWGKPSDRPQATEDATALLSWLATHDAEHVVLLLGNHDLARVCELFPYEFDADFEAAFRLAVVAYADGDERVEWLARDYSCYSAQQQRLVAELLQCRRLKIAHAHQGLLLTHAGVTIDDWTMLGGEPPNASDGAEMLNAFLENRIDIWEQGPLNLAPLHAVATREGQQARGVLCHRPSSQAPDSGRRYSPLQISSAFPQAIGHIRDSKCRQLLGDWAPTGAGVDGPLRSLRVEGETVQYQVGLTADARMYFLDGGMLHAAVERYELLNLDTRTVL